VEPGWFPILDLNGDLQICVDLESGAVFGLDTVSVTSWRIATKYVDCVDAILEALSTGAIAFSNSSGAFETTPAWRAVAAKLNFGRHR
jgi:hypothetical protein